MINEALKYFASICHKENVPTGISVTDSGKFVVKLSLSESVEIFPDFLDAVDYIVDKYKKSTKNG